MSKKKIFQAFLTSFLFCVVLISFVPVARALTDEERCQQFQSQFIIDVNGKKVNTVGALPACGSYSSFSTLVVKGINIALAFAGAGAALFIIIGGYWYLTSAGNEEAAEKGRKTMVNAVIGLAAIILSFTIVRVVGNLLTSSTGTPEAPSSTTDN